MFLTPSKHQHHQLTQTLYYQNISKPVRGKRKQ